MNLILLGAPGAGKGTVSAQLISLLGLTHVSTGDLFRQSIAEGTPLGIEAKHYIEAGCLVPDTLTANMLQEHLRSLSSSSGYIFDGFPRTIPQAEALDRILAEFNMDIDLVLLVEVDYELICERISQRRVCPLCGASYHLTLNAPARPGLCDHCAGELQRRADDSRETVMARLKTFEENTKPLIQFYEARGLLRRIDNSGPPEALREILRKVLST
ncbi:MAG: adenylate kinase [Eubacteriales bacterium]|nr:adenylate kinase [Eubacteriales bacterium]